FVSHDRKFIENVANRVVEIQNKDLTFFDGTYKQYKSHQSSKIRDSKQDESLLLETKISEVLSRLSIEPSDKLEREVQKKIKEKKIKVTNQEKLETQNKMNLCCWKRKYRKF